MARAAAKRRPPVRHDHDRRRHKDSGGQRFEDTLFFNRLRKRAKWVFIFLAVVFAGGFVLFGVGSSNVSGLGDIFNGIGGGSSGPSVKKELKKTQEHPKSAQAWRDLATAYETDNDLDGAIGAWSTYVQLRPKDVDGLSRLAADYEQRYEAQLNAAAIASSEQQSAENSNFGPPASTPLGRALGSVSDPIASAISSKASDRYNQALQQVRATSSSLLDIYRRIVKLQPEDPRWRLQLAQVAQNAGDTSAAIAAYQAFVRLAPYDPSVPFAKQQIKTLKAQLTTQGS